LAGPRLGSRTFSNLNLGNVWNPTHGGAALGNRRGTGGDGDMAKREDER
jgi:hypothetical protein